MCFLLKKIDVIIHFFIISGCENCDVLGSRLVKWRIANILIILCVIMPFSKVYDV
jgi:hypothetical protein